MLSTAWATGSTPLSRAEKPREPQLREALEPLDEASDLTSAYFRYLQLTDEEQRASEPSRVGRRGMFRRCGG